jgi:hypothetical protein
MAILATSTGSTNYEPMAQGNYPARCYSMVHMGTIEEIIMGEKKVLNKVRITWELPTELKVFKEENGEQPHVISKEFTLSMHEKATLRNYLKNWRGKDFTEEEAKSFDIEKLIGVPCMLNITHKKSKDGTKTYAEIGSISAMPRGFECPKQINPSFVFTYDDFSTEKFNTLPEFIRNKMVTSLEYKQVTTGGMDIEVHEPININNENTDDMPF